MDPGLFATKIAAAAVIVLGLSVVAERVSPRAAGILSGAPLGALITFYFVGMEAGTDFVVASVPHAVAGMSGTLLYVYIYYRVSAHPSRWAPLISAVAGLAGYFAVAFSFNALTFTLITGLMVIIPVMVGAGMLMRRTEMVLVRTPARLTLGLLAVRAGTAAALVSTVASLAQILGPTWAGLLVAFPMTLLPTMLIIHVTYSETHVQAMLQGFPLGIGSLITYLVAVTYTFPAFGVHVGTLAAVAASMVYLAAVPVIMRSLKSEREPGN